VHTALIDFACAMFSQRFIVMHCNSFLAAPYKDGVQCVQSVQFSNCLAAVRFFEILRLHTRLHTFFRVCSFVIDGIFSVADR
jgi:hypothetical protein